MNTNSYSRIFEKMGGNPFEYQRFLNPIFDQIVAENKYVRSYEAM